MRIFKKTSVTHVNLSCQDCDWHNEDYINGSKEASKHAINYHHLITGEYAHGVIFNGRLIKEAD